MSVISSVVSFCFDTLKTSFAFLARVEVSPGVPLLYFVFAIIIISTVLFGLISTVRIVAGRSVGVRARHVREREAAERREAYNAKRYGFSNRK